MPSEKTNCFVDTNVLVYAIDPEVPEKRAIVADLLRLLLKNRTLVLSPQTLNECYQVITRRRGLISPEQARQFISSFLKSRTTPHGNSVIERAWQIEDQTGFLWWDCVQLASASLARCGIFISESLEHGRKLGDLKIMNPFHPDFLRDFNILNEQR